MLEHNSCTISVKRFDFVHNSKEPQIKWSSCQWYFDIEIPVSNQTKDVILLFWADQKNETREILFANRLPRLPQCLTWQAWVKPSEWLLKRHTMTLDSRSVSGWSVRTIGILRHYLTHNSHKFDVSFVVSLNPLLNKQSIWDAVTSISMGPCATCRGCQFILGGNFWAVESYSSEE